MMTAIVGAARAPDARAAAVVAADSFDVPISTGEVMVSLGSCTSTHTFWGSRPVTDVMVLCREGLCMMRPGRRLNETAKVLGGR